MEHFTLLLIVPEMNFIHAISLYMKVGKMVNMQKANEYSLWHFGENDEFKFVEINFYYQRYDII